jgi:hypothetical protein
MSAFHGFPGRRRDLVVIDHHRARILLQPLHALLDNAVGLAHFFDSDQITVVAIAIDANRNVKIHLIINIIRLLLPQIPGKTRTAQHRPGETQLQGSFWSHHANADRPLFPNPIVGQQRFVLINRLRKPLGKRFE